MLNVDLSSVDKTIIAVIVWLIVSVISYITIRAYTRKVEREREKHREAIGAMGKWIVETYPAWDKQKREELVVILQGLLRRIEALERDSKSGR